MDMLKFLNEKLKNGQDFVTLLSDNGISPKIFTEQQDGEEGCGENDFCEEDEDQEIEQEEQNDNLDGEFGDMKFDQNDFVNPSDLYTIQSSDQDVEEGEIELNELEAL